jgi:CMP-2-keto-3-deoxyoctulosonic acid synthetase
MERTLTVIPARYASHRLPGKVLEEIHGFPMIYWVYQQVLKAKPGSVVIAADHPRVYDTLERLDIPYLATDPACKNGTERVHEVAEKYPEVNYFVNVQGDEPLLNPKVIAPSYRILKRIRTDTKYTEYMFTQESCLKGSSPALRGPWRSWNQLSKCVVLKMIFL